MAQATILFADNNPDFLATRKEFLEQKGYRVIPVLNPTAARAELDTKGIDLAILDIRLVDDEDEKDLSGLALAQAVAYQKIPTVILSGFPSTDAVREALRPGPDGLPPAVDFLEKEEGPEALIIAIEHALATSRKHALAASRKRWRSFLGFGLMLLLGAVLAGAIAIIYGDPRWLIFTAILGILFTISAWRLAVE